MAYIRIPLFSTMTKDQRSSLNSLATGRSDPYSSGSRFHVESGYDSGTRNGRSHPWITLANLKQYNQDLRAPRNIQEIRRHPERHHLSLLVTRPLLFSGHRTGDDISNVLGLIARVAIDDRRKWKFDGEALMGSLSQLPFHSLLFLTPQKMKENGKGHLLFTRPPGYRT